MKSKSPFAMKSPLLAYKSDMKGNYANPEYVPETIVGAEIGANIAKTAASVFDSYANSKKSAQSDSKKAFDDLANTKFTKFDSGLNTDFSLKGKGTSPTSEVFNTKTQGGKQVLTHEANADKLGYKKNTKERSDFIDASTKFNLSEYKTDTPTDDGKTKNYINMNGSPVKHNAGAVGSIASGGGQNNPSKSLVALFGQDKANNMQQKMTAMKSQQSGSGIFGTIAQAASQGGSIVGSIGQQMGNQAQQRAAKLYTNRESNGPTAEAAGGMIGVTGSIGQDVLPPPNQVAETGSYGGGGDRILEMDSNPVGNQSIGRDTDVASQLFGSGQRASMLAMKGTPLHTEGHGGAKGHTHAKPGDDLDQTVAENMGVNDIENYKPIQGFKGGQIVVNSQNKDTIFSKTYPKRHGSTFVIPEQMDNITRSSEGTPEYKPVYINRNKKQ